MLARLKRLGLGAARLLAFILVVDFVIGAYTFATSGGGVALMVIGAPGVAYLGYLFYRGYRSVPVDREAAPAE